MLLEPLPVLTINRWILDKIVTVPSLTVTISTGLTNVTERLIVQAVDGGSPQQSSVCNILVLIGSLSTIDLKPIFTSQVCKRLIWYFRNV